MINKKIIILTIIMLLVTTIVLTGCSRNNDPSARPARKITGKSGLDIDIDGKNKIELFGNYDMTEVYQITITNNGKFSIQDDEFAAQISLKDGLILSEENSDKSLLFNSLSDFNNDEINELEGLSQVRTESDLISRIVSLQTNVPSGQGITTGFDIKTCYKYETIFSETICVNTIKNGKKQNCDKSTYNFNSGQGAPIVISKVEVADKMVENNLVAPKFIITIENSKKEIATLPEEYIGGCTGQGNLNKIKLTQAKLGPNDLNCKLNEGIIDLSKNMQTIICDVEDSPNIEFGDSFDTVLYILLEYGYSTSNLFNIDVIRK